MESQSENIRSADVNDVKSGFKMNNVLDGKVVKIKLRRIEDEDIEFSAPVLKKKLIESEIGSEENIEGVFEGVSDDINMKVKIEYDEEPMEGSDVEEEEVDSAIDIDDSVKKEMFAEDDVHMPTLQMKIKTEVVDNMEESDALADEMETTLDYLSNGVGNGVEYLAVKKEFQPDQSDKSALFEFGEALTASTPGGAAATMTVITDHHLHHSGVVVEQNMMYPGTPPDTPPVSLSPPPYPPPPYPVHSFTPSSVGGDAWLMSSQMAAVSSSSCSSSVADAAEDACRSTSGDQAMASKKSASKNRKKDPSKVVEELSVEAAAAVIEEISEEELVKLPTRELNRKLRAAGVPEPIVCQLKQKRRTLKNRGYATTARTKRTTHSQTLELVNAQLREQLDRMRLELNWLQLERDHYRNRCLSLRRALTTSDSTNDDFEETITVNDNICIDNDVASNDKIRVNNLALNNIPSFHQPNMSSIINTAVDNMFTSKLMSRINDRVVENNTPVNNSVSNIALKTMLNSKSRGASCFDNTPVEKMLQIITTVNDVNVNKSMTSFQPNLGTINSGKNGNCLSTVAKCMGSLNSAVNSKSSKKKTICAKNVAVDSFQCNRNESCVTDTTCVKNKKQSKKKNTISVGSETVDNMESKKKRTVSVDSATVDNMLCNVLITGETVDNTPFNECMGSPNLAVNYKSSKENPIFVKNVDVDSFQCNRNVSCTTDTTCVKNKKQSKKKNTISVGSETVDNMESKKKRTVSVESATVDNMLCNVLITGETVDNTTFNECMGSPNLAVNYKSSKEKPIFVKNVDVDSLQCNRDVSSTTNTICVKNNKSNENTSCSSDNINNNTKEKVSASPKTETPLSVHDFSNYSTNVEDSPSTVNKTQNGNSATEAIPNNISPQNQSLLVLPQSPNPPQSLPVTNSSNPKSVVDGFPGLASLLSR